MVIQMISSYISKLVQSQAQFPPAASLFWFTGWGDPAQILLHSPMSKSTSKYATQLLIHTSSFLKSV